MSGYRPPRWLERLLEWALPEGLSGQSTLGDLAEDFERRALASPRRARLWYAVQTASIVAYRVASGPWTEGSTTGSDFMMDIRWSLRSILRHPGFSFGVVAVLGLGLGANAAVFSVVDGTIRNTSWWSEPDATVAIWPDQRFSFGQLELYELETSTYRTVGGYLEAAFALRTPDGESESINGVLMTPALFRELAVQPALGRAFDDDDALLGMERVVVIGEALWRRSFGADPAALGSRINVGGGPATVIRIFLSVLDVHINRSPAAGEVVSVRHTSGAFHDARTPQSATENESNLIVLKLDDGQTIGVRQIAGKIARRIVCRLKVGDRVEAGQRFGMIKFGSSTELILGHRTEVALRVAVGQRVKAGVTVLAMIAPVEPLSVTTTAVSPTQPINS